MKRGSGNRQSGQGHCSRQAQSQSPMQSRTNLFDQSEYEKIESLHTESFEIEHELKTLTMRMSDFLTKQVEDKDHSIGSVQLYDSLRETLRRFQSLTTGWDQLFQQLIDQKSNLKARTEKEVSSIKKMYQYQLKRAEYQQKTLLQEYNQDFTKKEQEVYDAMDSFSNGLSAYSRTWGVNIKDLEFLKEQAEHTRSTLIDHQNATVESMEERVAQIFDGLEISGTKSSERVEMRRIQALEHNRELARAAAGNPPLSGRNMPDIPKTISPIHKLINSALRHRNSQHKTHRDELECPKSSRDDPHAPLSKRTASSKENFDETSVNTTKFCEELKLINQANNNGGEIQDNSRISLVKHEDAWDSTLENDESSDNMSEINKALEVLSRNRVLEPENLRMLEQIMAGNSEQEDHSMYLEMLKVNNIKDKRPMEEEAALSIKNRDMPLMRMPQRKVKPSTEREGLVAIEEKEDSSAPNLKRPELQDLNVESSRAQHTETSIPELACTTPSNHRFMFSGNPTSGDQKLEKTISQHNSTKRHSGDKENQPQIFNLVESKKKSKKSSINTKRNHIDLKDLLEVKSFEFSMCSPLATESEEKENIPQLSELHHVDLEEILKVPGFLDELGATCHPKKDVSKQEAVPSSKALKSERRAVAHDQFLKPGSNAERRVSQSNPTSYRNYESQIMNAKKSPAIVNQSKIKVVDDLNENSSMSNPKYSVEGTSPSTSHRQRLQELQQDDEKLESDGLQRHSQKAEVDEQTSEHSRIELFSREIISTDTIRSQESTISAKHSNASQDNEMLEPSYKVCDGKRGARSARMPSQEIPQSAVRGRCAEFQRRRFQKGPLKSNNTHTSIDSKLSPINCEHSTLSENRTKSTHGTSTNVTKKLARNKMMTNNSLKSFISHFGEPGDTVPAYNVNFVAFSERSEPLICPLKRLGDVSPTTVTDDEISADFLHCSFPPARYALNSNRFEVKIPRKQRNNGFSLKSIETADTASGFRNFNTNTTASYNHQIGTKDVKNFTGMNNSSFNASKLTQPTFTRTRLNQ